MTPFWLKQLVRLFVLPPGGPLVIVVAGLALAGRYPRRGRQLALAGVIALLLLSMPIVGELLIGCLDRSPALDLTHASGAQAIVILGGGTRVYAAEYRGATLNALSLERVRYGARVARATGLPVLVSGGAVRGAPPEAVLMRNALVNEFGVPVRWLETRSRNTHENAVRSAEILKANGIERVILVGHSFDFPRSRAEFEAAGIAVVPAPISLASTSPGSIGDFVPSAAGLQRSYYACYEALANAWYRMVRWHAGGGSGRATGETSTAVRRTR